MVSERRSVRVIIAALYGLGIFHSLIMAHPKKRKSSENGWKVPGRSAGNDQRYVPNHILSNTPSEVQTRTHMQCDTSGSSAQKRMHTETDERQRVSTSG